MGWTWDVHNIACKSTFNDSYYQTFIGQASDDANNDTKSSPSSPLLVLSATSPDGVDLPKWMLRNDDRDPGETSSKSSTWLRWNPPLTGRCCLLALLWSGTEVMPPLVPSVVPSSVLFLRVCVWSWFECWDPCDIVSYDVAMWETAEDVDCAKNNGSFDWEGDVSSRRRCWG